MTTHTVSRRWLVGYHLVRAAVLTLLGLLLLVRPAHTVRALGQGLGLILLTLGLLDLVASAVAGPDRSLRGLVLGRGLVTAILGALLVSWIDATLTVVAILVGMQLAVGGGVSIVLGTWTREEVPVWRGTVVRGVVAAVVGVLVIFWPDKSVVAMAVLLGVQWLFSGFVSTAVAVAVASSRSRR